MKKVLGVLVALLMVSSAMGDVNLTITQPDPLEGWLNINYATPSEPNLPRAFALKIEVDVGEIDAVQFSMGIGNEECATCEPFDIYPGNITIDEEGSVTSYGSPVAPPGAPDDPPPLNDPNGYIIVEMGSLYAIPGNAPAASGLLLRARITEDCTVCVSEEFNVRGGVVLENPDIDPTVPGPICETIRIAPPFPPCWLLATQCEGDIDNTGVGVSLDTGDFFPFKDAWATNYWDFPYGTGVGDYNPCADITRDGKMNTSDFFPFKDRYTHVLPDPNGECNTAGNETWPPVP